MSKDTLISEKRTIGPFSGIKFNGIGHVYISRGESTSLEVKAPAAILQKAKTEVKNDVLEIGFRFALFRWLRSIGEMGQIEFHITCPELNTIISNGAGKITGTDTLNTKDMTIKSAGAGNIELSLEAASLLAKVTGAGSVILNGKVNAQDVSITGAGRFDAFNLISESANVRSTGNGQANITVNKKLSVELTGVGSVKYKGEPQIESRITGLGKLVSEK